MKEQKVASARPNLKNLFTRFSVMQGLGTRAVLTHATRTHYQLLRKLSRKILFLCNFLPVFDD
jgi:hypothetical protein